MMRKVKVHGVGRRNRNAMVLVETKAAKKKKKMGKKTWHQSTVNSSLNDHK